MMPAWRKSSYSVNNGACIEVAVTPTPDLASGYMISARDSKHPDGPVLAFAPSDWMTFISALKSSPPLV